MFLKTHNNVEDGQFRFGNAEPAVGKEAIRDALVEFFSAINAMHHENIGLWLEGVMHFE